MGKIWIFSSCIFSEILFANSRCSLNTKIIGVISYYYYYHLLAPLIGTVQLPTAFRQIYGSAYPEGLRTKHLANTKQRGKSEQIVMRRRWPDILGITGIY